MADINIRDLIRKGAPHQVIDEAVIRMMELKYAFQVSLALQTRNSILAVDVYDLASQLPATSTIAGLKVKGFRVDGPLFEGSSLVTCFKGTSSYVLKYLDTFEKKRLAFMEEKLDGRTHPNIVPYELYEGDIPSHRTFMIMPKYVSTLEPISDLDESDTFRLWHDISDALSFLHSHEIAFMDVKPSNICVDAKKFILIDLGSVASFGTTSSCTTAFLPTDLLPPRYENVKASASIDWWMLAMTIACKIGPDASPPQGPKPRTKEEVVSYLRSNILSSSFLMELLTKVGFA